MIENETWMEEFEEDLYGTYDKHQYEYDIYTLITIIPIMADILIVYVTLKNRILYENCTNIMLVHYHITMAIDFVLIPLTARLFNTTFHVEHLEFICVSAMVEEIIVDINSMLVLLISIHWYINKYHPSMGAKFTNNYKFFLIMIYVIGLCAGGVGIYECCADVYPLFQEAFAVIGFFGFILYIFILNVMNLIMKLLRRSVTYENPKDYCLWFANIYAVTSTLIAYGLLYPLNSTSQIFDCYVILFLPLINLFLLYYFDPDYKIFLGHIFSGRFCTYQSEELNEGTAEFTSTNSPTEQVCHISV